jgi:hypothetical protein
METMTAAPSVADKLAALAAIPEKVTDKGGSKVPVVAITPELDAKLKEIAALKATMKDAEGYLSLLVADVMPQCEQLRRELSIKEQRHLTAISLGGGTVLVSQNKYASLPLTEEERLRRTFNGKFLEYFQRKVVLTVDVEKISGEALALLVRDGAAMKTETIKPTESLHFARSTDSNVAALCDGFGLKPVSFLKGA